MLLKHKTSIITGCNRGIGLHILETFAQNGANVFACYRKKSDQIIDNCKNLSNKFGVKVYPIFFDLKNNDELKSAFQEISDNQENIDILVNNAGIIHTSLFQMTKIENFKEIFDVNFFSYIDFTQRISKLMTKKKVVVSLIFLRLQRMKLILAGLLMHQVNPLLKCYQKLFQGNWEDLM